MSNQMYHKGLEAFLEGSIAALTDTLKVALYSSAYTPDLVNDQYYSTPVASGGLIGSEVTLTGVSGSAGILSAANTSFTSVASGHTVAYIVLYKSTGTNSTSPLICIFDTSLGLPYTTNGGDIIIAWPSGQVFTL